MLYRNRTECHFAFEILGLHEISHRQIIRNEVNLSFEKMRIEDVNRRFSENRLEICYLSNQLTKCYRSGTTKVVSLIFENFGCRLIIETLIWISHLGALEGFRPNGNV